MTSPQVLPQAPAILNLTYSLNVHIQRRVAEYPRLHRYTLGQELCRELLKLVTTLSNANATRLTHLRLASLELAIAIHGGVRILLAMCSDLKCIPIKEHAMLSSQLEEIGRQLHRWRDYTEKQNSGM